MEILNQYSATQQKQVLTNKYFSFVLSIYLSSWLVSNIFAVKIVYFWGITLTGGFLTFPITASLNTVIADVYGYKNARQAIWSGILLNTMYVLFIHLINILPSSPEWGLQKPFESILIPNSRIICSSLLAAWCSSFINIRLVAKLKSLDFHLTSRLLLSIFISLTIDLFLYFFINFVLNVYSLEVLKRIFIFAYFKKIFFEILLLPFIWMGIDYLKKIEGFDICDESTNFNPFSMDNIYFIDDYKKNELKNKNML